MLDYIATGIYADGWAEVELIKWVNGARLPETVGYIFIESLEEADKLVENMNNANIQFKMSSVRH